MAENEGAVPAEADWLRPETEGDDVRRYAAILWLHRWLILACVLIGTGVAIIYVKTAHPVYKAQTDLFISPVSGANTATVALGLITASSNPTGDVETAAALVTSLDAATAVKASLHLPGSPQQILNKISAQPVAQSDIVALTAAAGSPRAAATLANTFAVTVIRQRTAQFHSLLGAEIANLRVQLATLPAASAEAGVLQGQIAQLKALLASPLPDMRVSTLAIPPTTRASPRVTFTIVGGIVGGLALGLALAFMLELVDVRVRREQLSRLFRLPILAVIPREDRRRSAIGRLIVRLPFVGRMAERRRIHRSVPRVPETLSPYALEGYRTLRATLLATRSQRDAARSILVTSASAGEGKTTTAINLAFSFAASGAKVILLEADLRRPSIGKALGVEPTLDVASVLTKEVPVDAALMDSQSLGSNLRLLLADSQPDRNALSGDALLLPTAAGMLASALRLADIVVVDAPPLAEVIDALELARLVDDVLMVVMLGQTRVPRLVELGEFLARTGIKPVGIVLLGAEPPKGIESYAYGYVSHAGQGAPPPSRAPGTRPPGRAPAGSQERGATPRGDRGRRWVGPHES